MDNDASLFCQAGSRQRAGETRMKQSNDLNLSRRNPIDMTTEHTRGADAGAHSLKGGLHRQDPGES